MAPTRKRLAELEPEPESEPELERRHAKHALTITN